MPSAGLALAQGLRVPDRRADQRNVYVGGAIDDGSYDTDFKRTNDAIRSTGATSFRSNANSTDTMWRAYVGYRFSPYFSLEAGYWNFGEVDLKTKIFAPVATKMERKRHGDGFEASAQLWVPVSTSLSGLVRAGALRSDVKPGSSDPGGEGQEIQWAFGEHDRRWAPQSIADFGPAGIAICKEPAEWHTKHGLIPGK